ncbi:uncharacterized protein A4U43_C05F29120 [Asparagus officinalis]|uniref:Uncharacterized protein n=1 Tax=Asparagus officinalis TaxID=4686 RepID=A0A5P1EVE3_ASPOF|nr:uncharacterized protein A4U43_C05F29120 [Asparagus officinalis]
MACPQFLSRDMLNLVMDSLLKARSHQQLCLFMGNRPPVKLVILHQRKQATGKHTSRSHYGFGWLCTTSLMVHSYAVGGIAQPRLEVVRVVDSSSGRLWVSEQGFSKELDSVQVFFIGKFAFDMLGCSLDSVIVRQLLNLLCVLCNVERIDNVLVSFCVFDILFLKG